MKKRSKVRGFYGTLYYTNETILEILKLILSDISKIFYGENYMWGNKRPGTKKYIIMIEKLQVCSKRKKKKGCHVLMQSVEQTSSNWTAR
jgi:hypothetical protein